MVDGESLAGEPDVIEREIKIATVDLSSTERSLTTLGAQRVAMPYWERNWVLDRDGELRKSGRLLRVRERLAADGSVLGVLLTVKAPLGLSAQRAADLRGVKELLEQETAVPEAAAILATLRLLGYPPVRRYEKVRSVWQVLEHEVVLDQTPIGDYVEVEGLDPRPVAETLGLSLDALDLRSYLAIYEDYRKHHPARGADMVFEGAVPKGFEALSARLRVAGLPNEVAHG